MLHQKINPPLPTAKTPGGNGAGGKAAQSATVAERPDVLPVGFAWSLDRSCDVGRAMLAASRRLREAGCDSPQLDSALLMAHVLNVSKTWLYAHPQRHLTETEIAQFEALVRRRIRQEPVAYLVGHKAFYGLDIIVNRSVLIPRPETELLVERVLNYIGSLQKEGGQPVVADIGTGSGAIAVAVALNAPGVEVYAVDVSAEALAVARQNIARYGLEGRVQLLAGHLTDPLPQAVDVIVANLPYIPTPQIPLLPATVRDYEPVVALDGGPDGLQVLRAFFDALVRAGSAAKLRPGGRIYLEIGADQGSAVKLLAGLAFPGAEVSVLPDYAGRERIVVVAT